MQYALITHVFVKNFFLTAKNLSAFFLADWKKLLHVLPSLQLWNFKKNENFPSFLSLILFFALYRSLLSSFEIRARTLYLNRRSLSIGLLIAKNCWLLFQLGDWRPLWCEGKRLRGEKRRRRKKDDDYGLLTAQKLRSRSVIVEYYSEELFLSSNKTFSWPEYFHLISIRDFVQKKNRNCFKI